MSNPYLESSILNITTSVFGQDITFTPQSGSVSTIKGVFSNAFIEVNGISTVAPALRVDLSDFDSPPLVGDSVTINLLVYSIDDIQPDGYGGAALILHRST
jgi:hypothetical protein